MPKAPRPIVLTLTQDEAAELLAPVGEGGQQTFHQGIINQLPGNNFRLSSMMTSSES
jgi:hypothetical protein